MRSSEEMFDLILSYAKTEDRVRAVVLNGSRANPNAPKDQYQDFDIIYVVRDFASFLADHSFIDRFGERLILQMPEAMRNPSGEGHFNWMMLFTDGNRLDLTLIPIEKLHLVGNDSQSIALLDKDGILPKFPPANDSDYHVKPPSALYYHSCCNNFFWCMQNVAKGIARDELPYVMSMYHFIIGDELHDMLSWYIGTQHAFSVAPGKMGKYYKNFLPESMYAQYKSIYADADYKHIWEAVFAACALFREAAQTVGEALGYAYNLQDDENMLLYLRRVHREWEDACAL